MTPGTTQELPVTGRTGGLGALGKGKGFGDQETGKLKRVKAGSGTPSFSDRKLIEPVDFILPVLCLALFALWASCLPVWHSPDEYTRLAVPFYIFQTGALPNGFEESIRNYNWGISYAFTPYGSALLSVVFMKVASLFTTANSALIFAARLASCVFGAGTVFVMELIGKKLFKRRASAFLLAFLLGALPQFAFLSSYVNNDCFSAFCAALTILAWILGIDRRWDMPSTVLLGVAMALVTQSYYFAYGLIVISLVVYFATATKDLGIKKALLKALVVFLVAFAISGWFFVRNALLYHGDFLGMSAYSQCSEMYANDQLKPSLHATQKSIGTSVIGMLTQTPWVELTLKSCVCLLGYMDITVPKLVYVPAIVIAVAGVVVFLTQVGRISVPRKGLLIAAFVLLMIFPLAFSIYRSWGTDYEPQGRYIVSAWIPFLIMIVWGFDALADRLGNDVVSGIVAVLQLVLCVAALMLAILPSCSQGIMADYQKGIGDGPAIMIFKDLS